MSSGPRRNASAGTADPLQQEFAERAALAGTRVASTSKAELLSFLESETAAASSGGVAIGEALLRHFPFLASLSRGSDAHALIAITAGQFGISSTGSVAQIDPHHERVLALLSRKHIVVLPPVFVASTAAALRPLRTAIVEGRQPYLSLVTGPSRTSDIERVLTIGVHGPAELLVAIVEDWGGVHAGSV